MGLKGALTGLVALAAGSWAKGLIDDVTDTASHVVDMSQRLGVSAEALQELGHAAGLSGSSLEGVSTGLRMLSRTALQAKDGSDEAKKALRSVRLDAGKLVDGSLTLDDALVQVADKFAGMPDGAKKSALAMKVFGRSGADLIPLLNEGSQGIADM